MNNKFKNSFIVVIVISLVVIIKIALKESIREEASNELEKTYTPSNNTTSNTTPVFNELTDSSSAPVKDKTTYENSEIETEEITDGNKISRKETETWILGKLTNYSGGNHLFNYSFSFQDGYLVFEYDFQITDERPFMPKPTHHRMSVPINDFFKAENSSNFLTISTNGKTIKHYFFEDNKERMDNSTMIPFYIDNDPDLLERLQKAFIHLKNIL